MLSLSSFLVVYQISDRNVSAVCCSSFVHLLRQLLIRENFPRDLVAAETQGHTPKLILT